MAKTNCFEDHFKLVSPPSKPRNQFGEGIDNTGLYTFAILKF